MKNLQITFTSARNVELIEKPAETPERDDFVLIKTEKSVVSAGTELACLRGTESWAPFPHIPGYGSVGTVVETGSAVTDFKAGDRVFTYGQHQLYAPARAVTVKIPEDLPGEKAVMARIAAVAITAVRVSDAELGDTVAVIGLGLVGNFAAQLFAMAGCDVIGIDIAPGRREYAERCGVFKTLAPGEDLEQAVKDHTGGRKCRTVVDATGVPAVAAKAPALAGKLGELILLGSPRGEYQTDITQFLNYSHLANFGNITIKGAHEYRFPVKPERSGHVRHSFQSNVTTLLKRIADDRLKTSELISRVAKPSDCADVYRDLLDNPGDTMGVVFDWQ